METTVQARLDEETQAALDRLRRHGWSVSEAVREGIRLVDKRNTPQTRRKLIGIGNYDSGVSDLATNRKYLEDFGEKSMGRAKRKPVRGSAG